MAIADDRSKAVELALAQIEKQFGKGSIVRLGSKEALVPIAVVSTGSISFDAALGVGGIPRGRVSEVFGPESSGKTTICLQIIAEAQKAGGLGRFPGGKGELEILVLQGRALGEDGLARRGMGGQSHGLGIGLHGFLLGLQHREALLQVFLIPEQFGLHPVHGLPKQAGLVPVLPPVLQAQGHEQAQEGGQDMLAESLETLGNVGVEHLRLVGGEPRSYRHSPGMLKGAAEGR